MDDMLLLGSLKCLFFLFICVPFHRRGRARLVVMSAEERDAVLKECHDDPATGGHYGEHGTVKKNSERLLLGDY